MVARIILIFLLTAVAQARGATEVQGAQINGTEARARRPLNSLAKAGAAFRNCLEVYTIEAFPLLPRASAGGIKGMREAAFTG